MGNRRAPLYLRPRFLPTAPTAPLRKHDGFILSQVTVSTITEFTEGPWLQGEPALRHPSPNGGYSLPRLRPGEYTAGTSPVLPVLWKTRTGSPWHAPRVFISWDRRAFDKKNPLAAAQRGRR